MDKKTVLYLASGVTPYRSAFFQALAKDVELTVLYELRDSLERQWVVAPADETLLTEISLKAWKKKRNSAFCPEVIKYLKRDYDHIVIGGYSTPTGMLAILWLKLHRKKFILNADGGMEKQESRLRERLKRFFISSATCWLSSGDRTTRYLQHYGAVGERIFQYPFTSLCQADMLQAPPGGEEKAALRQALGITEEKVVISVGRFSYKKGYGKGYDVLLRSAVQMDKDIGWYIIGGEPTEEFARMKQDMGATNVHFVKFLKKEELAQYYKASDVFVLMTVGDVWGLVINEAMAKGLPVITTDKCVAGLELVTDDDNGYIIPVGDDQALTDRLNKILPDADRLAQMAKRSLERIAPYTIENMARLHMEAFEKNLRG